MTFDQLVSVATAQGCDAGVQLTETLYYRLVVSAIKPTLQPSDAFAAVALAAVCWDGVMTMAGSRSLRHALDYRTPFRDWEDSQIVQLLNDLLSQLREKGAQHLMVDAAAALNASQRRTAFAMAAEIMRSDGELQDDESNILSNLASAFDLDSHGVAEILRVMDVLHGTLDG